MILSARWVLPMDAPPIPWGAVSLMGDRIAAVGSKTELLAADDGSPHHDLGNAILLPGLVNAHGHLDYSLMRAVGPGLDFNDWIIDLTRRKQGCSHDFFLESARKGAQECLRSGITTVGDCTPSGHVAQALHETGLRGIVYPEVFGIDERDPLELFLSRLAEKEERQRPWLSDRVQPGISPHAPYSVGPALFDRMNRRSLEENLPLAIHLAESREEVWTLLGLRPWNSPIRGYDTQWTPPEQRPVAYMNEFNLLRPGVTFIHCVQVNDGEIEELAASGVGVVTCPRSNAYLRTGTAPVRAMLDRGVRLGLGTDGACSSGPVSLFEEMRAGWMIHQAVGSNVSTQEWVTMATVGSAGVLGLGEEIGTLTPGKQADLIAVSLQSPSTQGCDDPYDALVLCASAEAVLLTMVQGTVLWDPYRILSPPCAFPIRS